MPLAVVVGQVVRKLMAQYRRQAVLVAGHGKEPTEDKHFSARKDERVDRLGVVNHADLPVVVGGRHAADGNEPVHDVPDHQRARVVV